MNQVWVEGAHRGHVMSMAMEFSDNQCADKAILVNRFAHVCSFTRTCVCYRKCVYMCVCECEVWGPVGLSMAKSVRFKYTVWFCIKDCLLGCTFTPCSETQCVSMHTCSSTCRSLCISLCGRLWMWRGRIINSLRRLAMRASQIPLIHARRLIMHRGRHEFMSLRCYHMKGRHTHGGNN